MWKVLDFRVRCPEAQGAEVSMNGVQVSQTGTLSAVLSARGLQLLSGLEDYKDLPSVCIYGGY